MIFLNTTFCGGRHALSPLPTKTTPIMAIQIFDGTYNKLFLSSDASLTVNNFDDAWTYDTKVNADFNGNFEAGNVGFSVKTTDNIVIRRREKGRQQMIFMSFLMIITQGLVLNTNTVYLLSVME